LIEGKLAARVPELIGRVEHVAKGDNGKGRPDEVVSRMEGDQKIGM
jgi:hypothetical protein